MNSHSKEQGKNEASSSKSVQRELNRMKLGAGGCGEEETGLEHKMFAINWPEEKMISLNLQALFKHYTLFINHSFFSL